jgi:hypothetical protein
MRRWLETGLCGLAALGGMAALVGLASCGGDGAAPAPTAQESCSALNGLAIPASSIDRPTSGAIVQSASFVASGASGNANGEYCAVTGMVFPSSAGAPTMQFQVNLPTQWNQKALQLGGGAYDGSLVTGLGAFTSQPNGTPNALAQGYVTLGGDGGHTGSSGFDGTFALNEEALLNYGQLSVKKVHDVAMAIVAKRYGSTPRRFYFIGGSQGGHEALDAAARYGADYDGVIANYPAYNITLLQLASLNFGRALYDNGGAGWMNDAKRQLLVNAVYTACDGLDGVVDGIVSSVTACNSAFNIDTVRATLRCTGGTDTGNACLSDAQIAAVDRIASPYDAGFPIAGQQVFPAWPLLEGADFFFGGVGFGVSPVPSFAASPASGDALLYSIGVAHARYFATQNPLQDGLSYDPAAYQSRLQQLGGITDATQQSLDAFRARGGKLILVHGTADGLISPHNSVDYYKLQVQAFGQAVIDSFVRFYMIPGFDHGSGRYNLGYDGLAVLDAWVEMGQAPETIASIDNNATDPANARSRPMCRWPTWPRFTGSAGSENSSASYTCTAP